MTRPRRRSMLVHLWAFAAYTALALAFCWPLPTRLATHITGSPSGDAGAYVWNQWVFRHEVMSGSRWPYQTEQILALNEPADLSLHNYTVFADLMALPLQEHLGVVGSFNVVYLLLRVTSAFAMFVLALVLLKAPFESFLTGALFGFSPFLTARGTAHYSLVAAAPLPLIVLCVWQAARTGRWPWAVGAGLTLGWSAYCDPYYLVFCVLILAVAVFHGAFSLALRAGEVSPARARASRLLAGLAVVSACTGVAIAVSGGGSVAVGGAKVALRSLYNPALLFALALTGAAIARGIVRIQYRPDFAWGSHFRLLAVGFASALGVLAPFLVAAVPSLMEARFSSPRMFWRSSPAGVDLLAFFMPNPNHTLFGGPFRLWLARLRPDDFVENAASLTVTALAVVALAYWKRVGMPRTWLAFTLFFGLLALGPFVRVGGFNTALPTPWTLLRYVPGLSLARSPTRFAIVAMLGFAILFGVALRELTARAGPRLRWVLLGGVAALLAFELSPFPNTLHAAGVPLFYGRIAADPCNIRVLELPFGLRDGTRSVGDFNARAQFNQTVHGKALLGGYLSRIGDRRIRDNQRFAVTNALLTLSEGKSLPPGLEPQARASSAHFLRRSRLGFVVIDRSRASPELRAFAIDLFDLQRLAEEGPYELLVPRAALCPPSAGRRCAHSWPTCPLRAAEKVIVIRPAHPAVARRSE